MESINHSKAHGSLVMMRTMMMIPVLFLLVLSCVHNNGVSLGVSVFLPKKSINYHDTRRTGISLFTEAFVIRHHWRRSPRRKLFRHEQTTATTATLSHEEISRYARHLVLADVGMQGQVTLKNSSVLVIGAGGLGSPCLLYLAAAGVGHIGIVDADTVDTSNLQRQIIHGTTTVGVSKCQSAAQRIHDVNPHVKIRTYEMEFTSQTALSILQEGFEPERPYDVVVDGSDNFPTKYLINDVCSITGTTWIYSAIQAFEGQLSVFNLHGTGPDYRDLLPIPPPPGEVPSCAEGGVLGVLPGTMGCLQATEAIKYLLGHHEGLLSGRILIMNAMAMKFTEVGLQRTPGRETITQLIDYQGFCGAPQTTTVDGSSSVTTVGRTVDEVIDAIDDTNVSISFPSAFHGIGPQECLDRMVQGWSPWVLDVRLETEHAIVHLPFTDRVVPHRSVKIQDIPQEGDILVYCKSGNRSKKAIHRFMEMGVEPSRLYNLDGGVLGWQATVDPSMPRY